ncbi:hypothetical protein CLU79DRAFT_859209 [Phycomyces nitens]|nr:hypothetical protein CLU79DRAFT_859209 [Phycomyces nitens]
MSQFTEPDGTRKVVHEVPESVTIVNESTPLIPQTGPIAATSQAIADHRHLGRGELIGLALMTLSALGFSTMSLFVKLGGARFPSFQIVFARSAIQTLFGLIGCAILKVNPLGRRGIRGWLFVRGLAGTCGLACLFYSVTKLPLADATVVFFLGPTFTAIFASIALGESFSFFDGVCASLCMFGVVLVSKPPFLFGPQEGAVVDETSDLGRLFAIFCALLGAIMSAISYVTVRKVGKGAHFMVHVVYFGAIASILSPVGLFLLQEYTPLESLSDYGIMLVIGLSAFVGQCLLNQGLQLAPAGPATLMRMNDVAFAFLIDIFIFHQFPDIFSVLGASIIVCMTTALGLHKWYMHTTAHRSSA